MSKLAQRRILLAIAAVAFVIVGYESWRLFKVREHLQNLVKAKLEAAFGQNAHFDAITLGLGVVHVRSVQITPARSSFRLLVDELSVGFNVFHLLTNGFKPERAATKIVLTRPRLLIHRGTEKPVSSISLVSSAPATKVENPNRTRSAATPRDYSFIDNVTISNGQIILIDTLSHTSSLIAEGVSGWLESQGDGKAVAKLAGHLFSSESFDLVVEAGINFNRNSVSYVQANLRDHRLGAELPFILPKNLKIKSGLLNGNLRVSARGASAEGYDIAGRIYVRKGAVEAMDGRLAFSDIDMDVNVDDWNFRIIKATQRLNGSAMSFQGSIKNITHPVFDIDLASESLLLKDVVALAGQPGRQKIDGVIKLRASIRDSLENLHISGRVSSPVLELGKFQATALQARFSLADSILSLQEVTGRINGLLCHAFGNIKVSAPGLPIDMDLQAEGDVSPLVANIATLKLVENTGTLVAHASGELANPRIDGSFEVAPVVSASPDFSLHGSFTFSDRHLQVETATAQGDSVMTVSVQPLATRKFFQLRARGLERLLFILKSAKLAEHLKKFRIDANAEGPLDSLNVMMSISDRAQSKPLAQLVVSIKERSGEYRSNGYVRAFSGSFNEFTVRYTGVYRDSTLIIERFDSTPWLAGNLQVELGGDKRLRGKVSISGADLSHLVEEIERQTPKFAGHLYADLKLAGTMRAPNLTGNLWLVGGLLNGVGTFTAEADVRVNRTGVQLSPLIVQKDGMQYLRAAGGFDFSSRTIDLQATAKNFDANEFLVAVANVRNVMTGRASFDLHISGSGPRFPLYGSIELHKGRLVWFSYDRLLMDFGDARSGGNGSTISKQEISAASVVYEKENAYRMSGSARIPLNGTDSLRVALAGDGNFLSIIRDFTDYFEEPRSSGRLVLNLLGRYNDLKLYNTSLQFGDGFMRLGELAHAITDLSGDFYLDSRGEFIEIQQLAGKIGDATLRVENQQAPVAPQRNLKLPFRLFDSDLSLGTLIINSSHNGMLLHVPGLMERGETGRFMLGGRDGENGFLIAGPWAHPKFRGEAALDGVNFMFPFDESTGPADTLLTKILWNIDYDVHVVSRKDNRYVQKVPSPLDNVYVNIGIDDNVSELEFTGILSDSSFRTNGHGESTRGNIEYLDLNFRVEKFTIDFDRNDLWPSINGRAWTVYTDSTNFPQNIYLTPYTKNPETGEEFTGGRWDNVYFKLSSDNPNFGESQAQILAVLGYSLETAGARATEAVGTATDNRLLRPLFRPVERQLKRRLGLDIVRISSRLTRNFIESKANLGSSTYDQNAAIWRDTKLTLGKYLSDDVYFLYNGQIEAGINYRYQGRGYGLRHILGLEYRVDPTLLVQFEYDIDTLIPVQYKDDWKLWLRHSFAF
jgi:hypothetical protein